MMVALVANLLLSSPARAALCVRLSLPPGPRVGRPTDLQLDTFLPYWLTPNGHLSPSPAPVAYPFGVVAIDSLGHVVAIPVQPVEGTNLWTGVVRFQHPGLWVVRVNNFTERGMNRSCGSGIW